jgi:hypothetical protein
VGLYGALGYRNWLVGNAAEWGAILVFGFMGAAVMGLALIYNEIVAEIHNE